jgi:hypothetical protein
MGGHFLPLISVFPVFPVGQLSPCGVSICFHTIIGNIATNDEIYLHDDANNNNIENNVVDYAIEIREATNITVKSNSAVRAQRYGYLVAACSR